MGTGLMLSTRLSLPTSPLANTSLPRPRPSLSAPVSTGLPPVASTLSRTRASAVPAGPSPQSPPLRVLSALPTANSTPSLSNSSSTVTPPATVATVAGLTRASDTSRLTTPCTSPPTHTPPRTVPALTPAPTTPASRPPATPTSLLTHPPP